MAIAVVVVLAAVLNCSPPVERVVQIPVEADQIGVVQEVAAMMQDRLNELVLSRFPDVEPRRLDTLNLSVMTDTVTPLGGGDSTTTVFLQVAIQGWDEEAEASPA